MPTPNPPKTVSQSPAASSTSVRRPRIFVKSRRALPFFQRHPWVFAGAIKRLEGSPSVGDIVDLYSSEGQFIARGLYNPRSNIRVRLYSWDEHTSLDQDFWAQRLHSAANLRRQLFPAADEATGYRAVFSEADGLSGLIVDRYGHWLCVQWTSRALWEHRQHILPPLQSLFEPRGLVLRTEKGIGQAEGLEIRDGLLSGDPPPAPLWIKENGVEFPVDLLAGQKTGVFLDQRENRLATARYCRDSHVLDVFAYAGGFGLTALKLGEARSVLAIDSSEKALELARSTAERNGVAEKFQTQKSDAFLALEEFAGAKRTFDTVILDPPKMTRQRSGVDKALKGYHSLNRLAVDVLEPGGILVTCSCSGLVDRQEFAGMLRDVSLRSGRTLQILEFRGHAADHPISVHCPESAYLKCAICRVN